MPHQHGGGLRAHARHARDVVDGIAGEREVVGIALGRDAEALLDLVMVVAEVAGVVPVHIAGADELREVLVARDDGDAQPFGAHARGERADDVVGLELRAVEPGDAEVRAQLAAALELQQQVRAAPVRGWPCRPG